MLKLLSAKQNHSPAFPFYFPQLGSPSARCFIEEKAGLCVIYRAVPAAVPAPL